MLNLQLLNPNRIQIVTFLPYNMQTIEHQLLTKTMSDWGLHAILVFSFISIVLCVLFYVFTQGMRDFTYRIKNIILERIQKKETNN